jgi:hypothetical protein
LQLVRLAARTKGVSLDEYQKLIKTALPPEFQLRADLEIFMARCALEPRDSVQMPRPEELAKNETAIGLAFEAAARGGHDDAVQRTADGESDARFRSLVLLGQELARFGRE